MFRLIKKKFIGLSTGVVNGSNHTKCVSSSNQKCMTQLTLINLHPNEYSQKFHYYPFPVKLDPSRQILVPRTSQGRSPPTSAGRPLKILFDHPGDVQI